MAVPSVPAPGLPDTLKSFHRSGFHRCMRFPDATKRNIYLRSRIMLSQCMTSVHWIKSPRLSLPSPERWLGPLILRSPPVHQPSVAHFPTNGRAFGQTPDYLQSFTYGLGYSTVSLHLTLTLVQLAIFNMQRKVMNFQLDNCEPCREFDYASFPKISARLQKSSLVPSGWTVCIIIFPCCSPPHHPCTCPSWCSHITKIPLASPRFLC